MNFFSSGLCNFCVRRAIGVRFGQLRLEVGRPEVGQEEGPKAVGIGSLLLWAGTYGYHSCQQWRLLCHGKQLRGNTKESRIESYPPSINTPMSKKDLGLCCCTAAAIFTGFGRSWYTKSLVWLSFALKVACMHCSYIESGWVADNIGLWPKISTFFLLHSTWPCRVKYKGAAAGEGYKIH